MVILQDVEWMQHAMIAAHALVACSYYKLQIMSDAVCTILLSRHAQTFTGMQTMCLTKA